jgi:adenylate cyclase
VAKEQGEIQSLHEKLLMLESVARFVPKQFIRILGKENVSFLNLGDSKQINMTVLFTDIRGFTTLSETLSAEDTFRFVNSYLKRMGPVIQKHRGFIDKFMGDAIMALFADRPENAVMASIAMHQELALYNTHRQNSGYAPIQIGIGLNTGSLMLGTVGSIERLDTTVIGDAVNLSARIESLTKSYGVNILLADTVQRALPEDARYCLREVDSVLVKGKLQPTVIYELFDTDADDLRDRKQSMLADFMLALIHYKTAEFRAALEIFERCLKKCPEDSVSEIYIRRCKKLIESPPGSGWRGVVKLK